jgi:predicted phage-related endonuclease
MTIETIPWGSKEEWLARRIKDVTASDIAAVCGVSPYKTPLQVYAEKKRLVSKPEENNVMRRGLWLEPSGLFALQQEQPDWTIKKAQVYVRDTDDRIGATPDFVAVRPDVPGIGNIQMKTVAVRSYRDMLDDSGQMLDLPLHFQLQALTEAKLMQADWCAVLLFIVGEFSLDLKLVDVPLNDAAWQRIRQSVAQFWWHMDNDVPPPLTPSQDAKTLRAIYAKDDGEVKDLSALNQLPEMLDRRAEINAAIKAMETEKEEIDAAVMAAMASATVGTLPGYKITWKVEPRKGYTVEPSTPRVLRIKKEGAK